MIAEYRYFRGVTMNAKLFAIVLGACCAGVFLDCAGSKPPTSCTPGDTEMIAHAVECRAQVQSCGADAVCRAAVIGRCDAWGDARCGIDSGSAGAP